VTIFLCVANPDWVGCTKRVKRLEEMLYKIFILALPLLRNAGQNIYSGYTSSINTIPPQSGDTSLHLNVQKHASGSVKKECWIYLAKASRT
jgi:hypothetical protein